MGTKQNAFYLFLSLTRGNWRNALFIECKNKCKSGCKGYFMISDTEGVPMLYPVALFEEKTKEIVDVNECSGLVSKQTFESIYNRWLLWNVADKNKCSIEQLIENRPYDTH